MGLNDDEKKICVIKYQESVIVRGIEKKLKEMHYGVTSYESDAWNDIRGEYKRADLFIIYLPPDVVDRDMSQFKKELGKLLSDISAEGKKAIVIGDEDDKSSVADSVPAMWSHSWISRPLDIKNLLSEIKDELMDEDDIFADKHILIVDDDPSYAKIVKGWLQDDYKVDIVTAGMQAITFLSRKRVDLILLDYEMPVTDGPQVLEMLRQEPSMADIPVVFLTGVDSKEAVSRAAHLKPDGYILKSTSKGDMMMYLKKVFLKYQEKNSDSE